MPANRKFSHRRNSLTLLRLEDRLAPAVASFASGVLTIDYQATGTTAETVSILGSASGINLTGNVTGTTTNLAGVTKIVVQDSGGGSKQTLNLNGGSSVVTYSFSSGMICTGIETVTINDYVSVVGSSSISVTQAKEIYVYSPLVVTGDMVFSASTKIGMGAELKAGGNISLTSGGTTQLRSGVTAGGDLNVNSLAAVTLTSDGVTVGDPGFFYSGLPAPWLIATGTLTISNPSQTVAFNSVGYKASQFVVPAGSTTVINRTFGTSGFVQVDGTLSGTSSVGIVTVSSTGKIAPGNGTSPLSTQNITFNTGSVLAINLNGVGGLDQDRLAVTGTVNLANATLQPTAGYFKAGQVFKIIDNDGVDPIDGTFSGLSQGATVSVGGANFVISYAGGDGNDVTLTAQSSSAGQAPVVTSVILDEGSGGFVGGIDGTRQRSSVRRIRVTFSEPVNFTGSVASAFMLSRTEVVGTPGTLGPVSLVANPPIGPTDSVVLTFTGSLAEVGGSLVDGGYDFSIDSSQVSGVGGNLNGSGLGAGTNYSIKGGYGNKWYRIYGDVRAQGIVDQKSFVDFRNAFGTNNSVFDLNGDGIVSQSIEFVKFKNNFGTWS